MTALLSKSGAAVAAAVIDEFAAGLAGRAIRPGDADYDSARSIWNAAVDRRPGLIVRCRGTADVVAAVRFAAAHGTRVTVRGGGHNVAGRALCDDGLVIDLSEMRGVIVDPAARTVRVQGGATLGDMDRETHAYGLAVPAGIVSKTGIAGLTLGGGVGWLVRRYGLSCDNVASMQVVGADGDLLTASAEENPDLFWALKGGGGNFGVVTSFTFRAHPVSTILGGMLVWPRDRAGDLLRFYGDFMARAQEELTCHCAMVTSPDGMPVCIALACWSGDIAEGEHALAPLRAFGPPVADTIEPMPFPAMQQLLDGAFADGSRNYWRSSFVHGLTDEVIEVVVDHAEPDGVAAFRHADRILRRRRRARRSGELGLRPARDRLQRGDDRAVAGCGREPQAHRLVARLLRGDGALRARQPFAQLQQRVVRRGGSRRLR